MLCTTENLWERSLSERRTAAKNDNAVPLKNYS